MGTGSKAIRGRGDDAAAPSIPPRTGKGRGHFSSRTGHGQARATANLSADTDKIGRQPIAIAEDFGD